MFPQDSHPDSYSYNAAYALNVAPETLCCSFHGPETSSGISRTFLSLRSPCCQAFFGNSDNSEAVDGTQGTCAIKTMQLSHR